MYLEYLVYVKSTLTMSEVKIRPYKPEDYLKCRGIFTDGMKELSTPVMKIVFPKCFKMAGLLLMVVIAVSIYTIWLPWIIVFYLITCVILTALLYIYIYLLIMNYMNSCLNTDLLEIAEFYKGESCMWIAEYNGRVLGMVGLAKREYHKPGVAELQRLSVSTSVRGKGIGTLLVKTVLQFCKEQNYNKIILKTSCTQYAAIPLYKKCGFKHVRNDPYPGLSYSGLYILSFEIDL